MNDKVKILETANKKVATEKEFIAYFVSKYIEIEHITEDTIISTLNCTLENYYKLGLCRTPDINASDYLKRLNNISNYIGISSVELNKIIKRVNSVLQFTETKVDESSYLMAARDKNKKNDK